MDEFLNQRYPKQITLGAGPRKKTLSIRILSNKDEEKLINYFKRIPNEEKSLLKDDVNDEDLIRGWCRNVQKDKVLPLIALDKDRIVSDCTLHQERRGWQSHVGKLRVSTDPEYRGMGLSKAMVNEFVEVAPFIGLTILNAEVIKEQNRALDLFQQLGFNQVAILPDHIVDKNGVLHDLVIMSLPVTVTNPSAGD